MPPLYDLPPVVGVELYRQDAVVVRQGSARGPVEWVRSEVSEFSVASRKRLAFVASNTDVDLRVMITLTYPRVFPCDGAIVKRNFAAWRAAAWRRWDRPSYLWFLEFQKRGAPHIHVLLSQVPVDESTRLWLSQRWYDICGTGDERHLRAGTRIEQLRIPEGARHYVVKEMAKMYQKIVPEGFQNVGRFWGCSRDVPPAPKASYPMSEYELVQALRLAGWPWLHGDEIAWKTLYNAGDALTRRLDFDIIELSSIGANRIIDTRRGGEFDGV
jgi:hypothetical protein